jgi:hypothetical protein
MRNDRLHHGGWVGARALESREDVGAQHDASEPVRRLIRAVRPELQRGRPTHNLGEDAMTRRHNYGLDWLFWTVMFCIMVVGVLKA